MASTTLLVYYNAGSDISNKWLNEYHVWDGAIVFSGYRTSVPPSENNSNYGLISQTVTTSDPGDISSITKVEIGISYYMTSSDGHVYLVMNCGFNGNFSFPNPYYANYASSQTTVYKDITADSRGPGAGNWTWNDVVNLDIKTWVNNYSGVYYCSAYIYEVWLRITYDVYVPPANEPIPEQLHYYKNGIVNINIYPTTDGIDNYMNITYSGTQVGYIPIVSGNGTGSNPTDLRVRIDSSTYTVQSER